MKSDDLKMTIIESTDPKLIAKAVLSERERCAKALERLGRYREADVIRRPEQYQ